MNSPKCTGQAYAEIGGPKSNFEILIATTYRIHTAQYSIGLLTRPICCFKARVKRNIFVKIFHQNTVRFKIVDYNMINSII